MVWALLVMVFMCVVGVIAYMVLLECDVGIDVVVLILMVWSVTR